jgi:16S rRNA (guanine527-N7)-methyltransferase
VIFYQVGSAFERTEYNQVMHQFQQQVFDLLGLQLHKPHLDAFSDYASELMAWNEHINLTAIRDLDGIYTRHFLDSLTCLKVIPSQPGMRLVDVGTGAGFPGLVLKIILPDMRLTLVESVNKKADFCRHMVERLNLQDVEVITTRAEEIGQHPKHREQYDWAVARAVANLSILAEYLLPLVKLGGGMLAQKGENGQVEANQAKNAIHKLGGTLISTEPVRIPGITEQRFLIVARKILPTPAGYPRRTGIPHKKPLT